MWFFITMFICNLLIPLVMLLGGYFMYKKPPQKINDIVGYRTEMSKKNQDTWVFAHDYCGRLWIKVGIITLILTIALQIPFINSTDDVIGLLAFILIMVQLIVLICSILPVEKALKRTFDDKGVRRLE